MMQSFEAYIILLSFCIISVISANHTNVTNHTTNAPNTTIEANIDVIPAENILWSRLENYTCKDLMPAINIFYNISQSECESRCLSFFNNSMQCTAAVWYEYIKPTGNDVPRCYLFGQSCELEVVFEKPVTASFWYYNITQNFNCVNYPNNWKDNFFDDCDTYSLFNFCDYAYNSSTTAILSYQDTIYGFDALQVCCGCNGGLFNYNDRFLFEPKWKPTSILNIYGDYTDFVCEAVDIAATTSILVDEVGILDQHKFNFTQFVGLCQHLHASLYEKYKLLLSISADNNDLINAKNIYSDFSKFTQFDCVKNLLLNNVTICNNTDEHNLYPFIIDLEEDHIYINNHFINSETFLYHLPPTNVNIKSFCSFSMFLNTTFPTKPPTKEPTFEPTMEPTTNPTNEPTINPTQITSNPTSPPTNDPTYEPTFEPTTIPTSEPTYEPTTIPTQIPTNDPTHEPTFEPTKDPTNEPTVEPTANPTNLPTKNPTNEPTFLPTNNPTNVPSNEPTPNTINPTDSPSFEPTFEPSSEPTVEPTEARRRLLNHYYSTPYFKTNIMAAFLCQTGYTESPTISPTKYPTIPPTQSSRDVGEYDTTLEIDESSSENDTKALSGGAVAGIVITILALCILICGLIYCFVIKKPTPKAMVGLGHNMNAVPPPDMDESAQEEQKTDVPGPIPGMLEMQMVSTYESEMGYSWKGKRMRSWTNAEILDWIKCMNLGVWQDEILNVIESNGITGEDIVELKSSDDVGEAFEITDNKGLCKQIFKEIKDFKANLKGGKGRFRVNIFVGNEHLTLDEEVEKTDTIKKIKTMYKIQERIDFELNHIHFRYKRKELLDNKTLQQYGITNEKHLIEVELDKVFPIYIFAQGVNLTLNQKVTKDYKIQQIKEMYKSQSGVYANLQDIQFYKKSKLLESNKTLAQCGIVDDKHLISVRFETAGGGDSNI